MKETLLDLENNAGLYTGENTSGLLLRKITVKL